MEEFRGIDLGDQRLDRRAVLLVEKLLPSIPGVCNGWAETQAAYRFLGQEEMDWRDLLAPHTGCTLQRMRPHPVVLYLQDTTELDFNGQTIEGLAPLIYAAQRGMYVHPTYAVSPAREPLGVLDAWMWAREPKDADGQRGGLLESRRWPAQLGGFLGRKGDGEPGVKTIWQGLQRVMDFALGPRFARELQTE